MTDPTTKPPHGTETCVPTDSAASADSQPQLHTKEKYEAPKLRRLGTLLELTQSGQGARTEAFRGSR